MICFSVPVGILKISPVQKRIAHLYVVPTCALCRGLKPRASMAIYHLSASIVKRSAGRSVTAAAAYRAAAKIEDITTGLIYDYTRKKGVDYSKIISDSLADDLVKWMDKKIPIPLNILHKNETQETQEVSADSKQHIIIRREDSSSSVYTYYRLIDSLENKSLEIRHNRNRLEMISGVVTPSIAEQIKIITNELKNPEKVTFDVELVKYLTEPIAEPEIIKPEPEIIEEIVERPVTNTPKKTTKKRKSNRDRER